MSSDSNTIHNQDELTKPLIFPNFNYVVKLTESNYQHWKIQLESVLVGYDLFHFVDGSTKPPPSTINDDDENMKTPNPAFNTWFLQDKLLFGALVGTLSPVTGSLVTRASSSKEAWDILSTTYALSSRNHVKQLKFKLKNLTRRCSSISHTIQKLDNITDESNKGTIVYHEDITNKITDVVHARDNPINKEFVIQTIETALVPAFPKQKTSHHPTPKQILSSSKVLALGLLKYMGTLAYFCAKLSSRASHKLAHGTLKLRKHSRILGIKMRRDGDHKKYEFGEESFGEGGLWRKSILLGDKCDPLNFSGVIYYDCNGNKLTEAPVKSPRVSPFTGHGY